jgi:flagellar hook-associated protein 2
MAAIQSPGIGSGLDVNSIVSRLMAIERQPLTRLAQQAAGHQADISAFGSLRSTLSDLQDAVASLKDAATFQGLVAGVSDDAVLTASAESTAAPGRFDVTVGRLAQRHKLASGELDGTDTFGGTAGDELVLTVDTTRFTVDLSTAKTLTEIRDAINGTGNETGATATVVNGDDGKQTLALTAAETGYERRIQLSYGGNINALTFGFETKNKDSDGEPLSSETELDAAVTVDGVSVTRADNTIDDVVDGITLELRSEGSAEVTITRDTGSITAAVGNFVSAYNTLRGRLSTLGAGELAGDGTLLRMESQLRSALNTALGGTGAFQFVQEVGITTDEDGNLVLDSSALTSALGEDLAGVADLFSNADTGFAVRLDSVLEGYVASDGLIDARIDGLNNRIDGLQGRQEALDRRLEQTEARLRAQFTALDELVGQLQTTSNFLTQQLPGLPGSISNGQ